MSTYDEPEHSEFWYDYTRNDPNRENPFKKMPVDTEKYLDFVHDVTSAESLDYAALLSRTNKLEIEDDCNIPQLLTAEELTELVRLIHYDTVACNDEEQEFWNTIVRKLRNHYDS